MSAGRKVVQPGSDSMATLVSVIIPCYNQAHFLKDAIESVLQQDYPNKEIVVVNDGSPDNTRQVAASFGDALVYLEQENRGLSGARNAGIRASHGGHIALLDCDDTLMPGSLSVRAGFLSEHPEIGMVCSDAWLFDGSRTLGLKSRRYGRPKHPHNFRWDTVEYCATPSSAMLRRICFERVGYFDEALKIAAEDWLMWVKLSLHFNLAYLDQPLIRYRLHDQNATRQFDKVHAHNRYAVAAIVGAPFFSHYPAHFRARLFYFRCATAWRTEPKGEALRYFLRAIAADPFQIPYGVEVLRQGLANHLSRRRMQSR
jgi:glycosyltransferase involved in cell wall biosynthesis